MSNEKTEKMNEPPKPRQHCTLIHTVNGTEITIYDDGTVIVRGSGGIVAYDSSNPNDPPPPPPGH